jgi:hypothetical protein
MIVSAIPGVHQLPEPWEWILAGLATACGINLLALVALLGRGWFYGALLLVFALGWLLALGLFAVIRS